jgi:hypothetical protein
LAAVIASAELELAPAVNKNALAVDLPRKYRRLMEDRVFIVFSVD